MPFKPRKIQITHSMGGHLLKFSSNPNVPNKIGDIVLLPSDVSGAYRDIVAFYDLLKSYSPVAQREHIPVFGDEDNLDKREIEGGTLYKHKDDEKWIELTFENESQWEGMYWTILLMASPTTQNLMAVSVHSEVVWPVAKLMHRGGQLEKDLGLKAFRRREIEEDPVPAETTPAQA